MARLYVLIACFLTVSGAPRSDPSLDIKDVPFLMPEVSPQQADTYLCITMKMPEKPEYIVGFKPHANMEIAHHILLYGCTTPGRSEKVWNCGEMASKGSSYKEGPVCGSGARILYAWAMDAQALSLPKDVGFKVGGDTDLNYLVLQVHYKNVQSFLPPANGHDSSGITMNVTHIPQRRRAGVYLLGTGGEIDPHVVTYMETECPYMEEIEIHPFAFRTHAHGAGQVTTGYRIRDGQWTEIGRKSPKLPQMFYNNTTPGLIIQKGDILAARCTMKNDQNRRIQIGSTQNDEMCNFYMMYYTEDSDTIMSDTYCFSAGPPTYYWAYDIRMKDVLENIPDTASVIPGTNKVIKQTAVPGLYEEPQHNDVGDMYDIKGADMNTDPKRLRPEELEHLLQYLKSRGPRAYDDYYL